MKIEVAPTGRLVKGDTLDMGVAAFERALKDHDSQLYVKWNPRKVRGWGCWEIRRKPDTKLPVDYAIYKNDLYIRMEYKEIDVVNHVLDCAFLNYDQLRKIKEMDTFTNRNHFLNDYDYKKQQIEDGIRNKAKSDLAYTLKQTEVKRAINDFAEMVRSGKNPARIITGMPV